MSSMTNELVLKAEKYTTNILRNDLPEGFTFHNYEHTVMVAEGTRVIGAAEHLTDQELIIVELAAWFHDTGYTQTNDGHEEVSVLNAQRFLEGEQVDADTVNEISACILATKHGTFPQNRLQRVICDADMYHLSKDNYNDFAENLRKEWSTLNRKSFSDLEWYQLNFDFLCKHQFYTDYAKSSLAPSKETIKKKLKRKIKKLKQDTDYSLMGELGVSPEELKALKKKLQKAEGRPEKGIETMFRLTSKNHIDISGMADSKANIMISVNSIIISVLLGSLMQKLDSNPHLIPPTIVLLVVTLSSIVFSVLSLRPNVTSGKFTKEDIESHKTNLLFFGNFHKMKRDDYHWGMNRLMDNASFLYSSLIDDIYFLGVVLAKKYNYLRTAYNIFMYGIIVAVIAFVVAILLGEKTVL